MRLRNGKLIKPKTIKSVLKKNQREKLKQKAGKVKKERKLDKKVTYLMNQNIAYGPENNSEFEGEEENENQVTQTNIKMSDYLRPVEKLKLEGNMSENWRRFKRNFDIFLNASGIIGKSETTKVNTFLNMIGEDSVEVFDSFKLTAEQCNSYNEVVQAFENFCKPKKNTVYERFMFYQRKQRELEPFDNFLMDIKRLIRSCEFGDKEEEMLRDQIVMGVEDKRMQMKLLEKADLTCDSAIEKCRASEATKEQATTMNKTIDLHEVRKTNDTQNRNTNNVVNHGNNNNSRQSNMHMGNVNGNGTNRNVNTNVNGAIVQHTQNRQQQHSTQNSRQTNNAENKTKCHKCNYVHKYKQCPAFGKTCNLCSKLNHFASMCRLKNVSTVSFESDYSDNDELFIGSINVCTAETDDGMACTWSESIQINGKKITFKIDTGAQINVMPVNVFKRICTDDELHETSIKLKAFGGQKIKPIGKCSLFGQFKNVSEKMNIAVVDIDVVPIMGLKTCIDFGLVSPSEKYFESRGFQKNL